MAAHNFRVSLITTERNEEESIREFIESAMNQSLEPDEIIIADGGSTDGTRAIIQKYIENGAPIKLLVAAGNRSIGRNAATKAAKNEIIACTDVGSRLDKDWLKHITEPFRKNPNAMVVSGFFLPDPKTYFEKVSSTLMLQSNDNIDINTWLPSSRSIAYKKMAWEKAGGYPEHTNFNEDTPFDLALKAQGYKFEDGLKAVVYWRPRRNLREFYRQYYFYAVGDSLDAIDLRRIQKITAAYLAWPLVLILALLLHPALFMATLAVLALILLRRVYGPWKKLRDVWSVPLMIILIVAYDISQIHGFWYGRLNLRRLKNSGKLVR